MTEDAARTSAVDVEELWVDGVRVLHFPDESGLTEATLVFGVGECDETLPTSGTLHALEHAVMSGVRRTPIEINGSVGVTTTIFTATGSGDLVSTFLTGVCEGLADPPVGRLQREALVLEAEGDGGTPTCPAAAIVRYGFRGLGAVGAPGPGPSGVRAAAVREMASRWFVAANALLVVEGDLPEGLRLPLADGPRPSHATVAARPVGRRAAVSVDGPACDLNFLLPAEPVGLTRLTVTVIDDRLTEVLRHDRGLVYSVDIDPIRIPGAFDVTVRTDPTAGRVRDCVLALVETVRTLVDEGPSESEVVHARAVVAETLQGRVAQIARLVESEIEELVGMARGTVTVAELGTYSREDVAALLRRMAEDLIYVVDEMLEPDLASLGLELVDPTMIPTEVLPTGEVFRPPALARALHREARASRLILTPNGLGQAVDGRLQQVAWPEVVGVMMIGDGDVVVFGSEGQAIPAGPSLYNRGQRLVDAVLANVAGDLVFDAPPDDGLDGR